MMESEREQKAFVPLPATNGPRPHRCDICQRSFREVATLRKHEQLHRADRPYTCQTCGKSFLWSSNLKVHERVHTGERPYKCKICHRCFTQSNDLRRHERNVHMRGKLYSYKAPPGGGGRPLPPPVSNPNHMNLAAYQAFAIQQRAILQHALTYESLMQNSGSHFMNHMGSGSMRGKAPDVSTSLVKDQKAIMDGSEDSSMPRDLTSPLKVEQVTPPPRDQDDVQSEGAPEENGRQSPGQSGFSPSSSKTHSPPALTSTTFGSLANGHHAGMTGSPDNQKEERPLSHESQYHYTKYFNNYAENHGQMRELAGPYSTAFNSILAHHGAGITSNNNAAADSVMDLSMNKSLSSLESEDCEVEWKMGRNSLTLSSKSPDSESESDSKRDVTTTSDTPTADSGIHHCPHCNIFYHDYTMFNLHQSLHSPMDEDPFLCPSCLKHCQDRIEFMFHIVWHVKYPHTSPKYQSFKDNYMLADN